VVIWYVAPPKKSGKPAKNTYAMMSSPDCCDTLIHAEFSRSFFGGGGVRIKNGFKQMDRILDTFFRRRQGDQIGRIFADWAIVFLGQTT
jgi:hypothetical protein